MLPGKEAGLVCSGLADKGLQNVTFQDPLPEHRLALPEALSQTPKQLHPFFRQERGGCPSSPRPSRSLERMMLHYRTHLPLLLPGQCCLAAAPFLFRPLSS